ncbi:hypothetical protein HN358_04480 [Candidatus Uhrbacteria bacterium]|jgi:hypothetical protein|nr:hypothetical protein [Candidatus Uhrbacteria bacterium]MBT7717040.1 hypothetical protein [Candidatus Uhrbacteria bacterium]
MDNTTPPMEVATDSTDRKLVMLFFTFMLAGIAGALLGAVGAIAYDTFIASAMNVQPDPLNSTTVLSSIALFIMGVWFRWGLLIYHKF